MFGRDHRGHESHAVHDRQTVYHPEDIAHQERADGGGRAIARNDAQSRQALAGRAPAHQDLEEDVIEKKDRKRRPHD